MNNTDHVQDCLHEGQQNKTQIVSQNLKDFHEIYDTKLGKGKSNKINPIFEYRQQQRLQECGVKECLSFQNKVTLDQDLGRSTRHGLTNVPKKGDENRVFGLPTEVISQKLMNLKNQSDNISFFSLLNYNYDN